MPAGWLSGRPRVHTWHIHICVCICMQMYLYMYMHVYVCTVDGSLPPSQGLPARPDRVRTSHTGRLRTSHTGMPVYIYICVCVCVYVPVTPHLSRVCVRLSTSSLPRSLPHTLSRSLSHTPSLAVAPSSTGCLFGVHRHARRVVPRLQRR